MKNKKGTIAGEMVMMVPKIIFLVAALFAVVIIVRNFIVTSVDVRDVESSVLVSRILNSADGISYVDPDTKRIYPGVIDADKFRNLASRNPNALDEISISYGTVNPVIAAKISLKARGTDSVAYYNKERYDKWEPRALPTVRGGSGSIKSFTYTKYILAREEGKLKSGTLEFHVLI